MLLSELISLIDYDSCIGFRECEVTGVTDRSSEATGGMIFVCIKGYKTSGERYVGEALSNGACAIVTSDESIAIDSKTVIFSKNARKTLAEIAKVLYFSSNHNIKIIGITGTKGKTTTAEMLYKCLKETGIKTVSIDTLGIKSTDKKDAIFETENTTPSAQILYRTLGEAARDGAKAAVIEVSSQALASWRVYGIPFDVCIFTGLSEDHIGNGEHKDFYEYREAKRMLFRDYGARVAIVNSSDPEAEFMARGVKRVVRVGFDKEDDYRISDIGFDLSGLKFSLNRTAINIGITGEYNAINAALAIAAACEISGEMIARFTNALLDIDICGRLECWHWQNRYVVIDFAHNPKSFEALFTSVSKLAFGKIIAVYGSVGNRCRGRRANLAAVAERFADISIITADDTDCESVDRICAEIYGSYRDKSRAFVVPDRREAIEKAFALSEEGDFILLLGKGHEKYQIVNGRRIPFSEQAVIASIGAVRGLPPGKR